MILSRKYFFRSKYTVKFIYRDPLDDILESTKRLGSAYSVGDVRQNSQQEDRRNKDDFNFSNTFNNTNSDYREKYRNRNCQSVTTPRSNNFSAAPARESEDAADSWLSGKLKKVRSKRDIDPDIVSFFSGPLTRKYL